MFSQVEDDWVIQNYNLEKETAGATPYLEKEENYIEKALLLESTEPKSPALLHA